MALGATFANDLANLAARATAPTAFTAPIMLSIHTADPGTTGASEAVNGGGSAYARQAANYNAAAGGICLLAGVVSFTNMPAGTFTHFGVWDSSGTPKFIMGDALASPQTPGLGNTLQLTSAPLQAQGV